MCEAESCYCARPAGHRKRHAGGGGATSAGRTGGSKSCLHGIHRARDMRRAGLRNPVAQLGVPMLFHWRASGSTALAAPGPFVVLIVSEMHAEIN